CDGGGGRGPPGLTCAHTRSRGGGVCTHTHTQAGWLPSARATGGRAVFAAGRTLRRPPSQTTC
ncbi:hypothetical protein JYU34_013474, partial [Plutella xylostella]